MNYIQKKINIALFVFAGAVLLAAGSYANSLVFVSGAYPEGTSSRAQSGALAENSFELTDIIPEKIFTPGGEYSDFIEFIYENPKEARVTGSVYSLRGSFVSFMESGSSGNIGNSSGSLLWRGRYSSGGYVPGGVYLYRIEITGEEEKVVSGTIIVAR